MREASRLLMKGSWSTVWSSILTPASLTGVILWMRSTSRRSPRCIEIVFCYNLLVRTHFIIVKIRCTGLAPCEFEFPFSPSLESAFLGPRCTLMSLLKLPFDVGLQGYLTYKKTPSTKDPTVGLYLGPCVGPRGGGCLMNEVPLYRAS